MLTSKGINGLFSVDIGGKSEKEGERRFSASTVAGTLSIFILLTYVTLMFWIILLSVFGVLVAVNFTTLRPELCTNLATLTTCYNVPRREQFSTPFVRLALELNYADQYREFDGLFCGRELAAFCSTKVSDWSTSAFAFSSCFFVIVGLIHFLMCMTANLTTVNLIRKYGDDPDDNIVKQSSPFIVPVFYGK